MYSHTHIFYMFYYFIIMFYLFLYVYFIYFICFIDDIQENYSGRINYNANKSSNTEKSGVFL